MHVVIAALAGVAFGIFCPGVARRLKSLFVKEANSVKADIHAEAAKVEKKL